MTSVPAPRCAEISSCHLPKPWLFCPHYQLSCRDCLPSCYSNNFTWGQTPSPHFLSDDGSTWAGVGYPSQGWILGDQFNRAWAPITGERVKRQFRLGERKSAPMPCSQTAGPAIGNWELAGSNLSPGHCSSEGSSSRLLSSEIPSLALSLLPPTQKSLRSFETKIMGCQNFAVCKPVVSQEAYYEVRQKEKDQYCLINAYIQNLEWSKTERERPILSYQCIYTEFRKTVLLIPHARQQRRHRCEEQTFGLSGKRGGCDDLRE